MTIDPIPPSVLREAAPYSLPQVAATSNDRESQAEGIPPMEISAAEQQVLRWLRNHLPGPPARRSRSARKPGREASEESPEDVGSLASAVSAGEDEETRTAPEVSGGDADEEKQQETGTLFDDRL